MEYVSLNNRRHVTIGHTKNKSRLKCMVFNVPATHNSIDANYYDAKYYILNPYSL